MKGFAVLSHGIARRNFICYGDEKGKCKSCVARFCCYTGELPDSFYEGVKDDQPFADILSQNLFGEERNLIKFDEKATFSDQSVVHLLSASV